MSFGPTDASGGAIRSDHLWPHMWYYNANLPVNMEDYAAVRLLASAAITSCYVVGDNALAQPSGFAGIFQVDPLDTTSADNAGTILVDVIGRRWKRAFTGAVNVKWFGATGDGTTDDTAAIQAAFNVVKAFTRGGSLYIPRGRYSLTHLDFSNATSDYTRGIRVYGDGAIDTQLIFNTAGVGIDCIGRPQISLEGFFVTSGSSAPSIGILFARDVVANSVMFSLMRDIHVEGNFAQACCASIACESFTVDNCYFNNTNDSGGLGYYTGNAATGKKLNGAGAYVDFTVASTHGTIFASSNTSIKFIATHFLCYGDYGIPFSADGQLGASFFGCEFIPTTAGATACVLLSDNYATPFNGPVNFYGGLMESGTAHGVLLHSNRASPTFQKLTLDGVYMNLFGSGQESVSYAGAWTGTHQLFEFNYERVTRAGSGTDSLLLDYCFRCNIDTNRGTVKFRTALIASRFRGTREFTRSAENITWTGNDVAESFATAAPTIGIFTKGDRVYNSEPAAAEYIGWTACANNGGAWSVSRANTTNYAVGVWFRDAATAGIPVYEVTATSGAGNTGAAPPAKPANIGLTVVDGDLTLTLRSNNATTISPFGLIA